MDQIQNSKYNIRSLIKAFNILELLVEHEKLSIAELNNMTSYGKSTVHRIAGTFKALNYVDQDTDGKYYATIKLFELGNRIVNRIPIINIVRPYLEELFEECRETVNLGIIDNNEVIFIDKILTKEPLRIDLEVGRRVPAHCSALGKVIMAYDDDLDVNKLEFSKFTEKTIDSPEELEKVLNKIRKYGYAYDDEEYIDGLVCMARPILNSKGNAVAAMSIALPRVRLNEEKKEKYLELLEDTISKIHNKIDY